MLTTPPAKRTLRILIADDHANFRQLVRDLLIGLKPVIVECASGDDAVLRFVEDSPDWVIMDVEMTPMDGLTATRLIKERYPEARILVVTNYQDASLRDAAFEAGAIHFLLKEDAWQIQQIIEAHSNA